MFKLGKALELGQYSGYRSMYPVLKGEELIAFLSYPEGWGGTWTLHKVMLAPADYPERGPKYDGCIPVVRRTGADGSVRIYRKDGKAGALEYLADEKARESFKTKRELIDAAVLQFNANRRVYANVLASCIKKHDSRTKQRETLTQMLAMDSLLVGEQRLMMLDLLREVSNAVDSSAKDIESSRKTLEEHEANGKLYEAETIESGGNTDAGAATDAAH